MKNLTLYYDAYCPFCKRVIAFMDANDIKLDMKEIVDPAAKSELVNIGGKAQVPCLFIDGTPLYESDDIIAYLAKEFQI